MVNTVDKVPHTFRIKESRVWSRCIVYWRIHLERSSSLWHVDWSRSMVTWVVTRRVATWIVMKHSQEFARPSGRIKWLGHVASSCGMATWQVPVVWSRGMVMWQCSSQGNVTWSSRKNLCGIIIWFVTRHGQEKLSRGAVTWQDHMTLSHGMVTCMTYLYHFLLQGGSSSQERTYSGKHSGRVSFLVVRVHAPLIFVPYVPPRAVPVLSVPVENVLG
jgi:hypothetical protein